MRKTNRNYRVVSRSTGDVLGTYSDLDAAWAVMRKGGRAAYAGGQIAAYTNDRDIQERHIVTYTDGSTSSEWRRTE